MNTKIKDRESYQRFYDETSGLYTNRHVTGQWARCHWMLPIIKGDVLEVGPQWGGTTKIFGNLPNITSYLAIDITDKHIEETQKTLEMPGVDLVGKVELKKCFLEDLTSERKFTTILLLECLEHFLDDQLALHHAFSLLENFGNILITVPYEDATSSPDHLRSYTLESFTALVQTLPQPYYSWISILCEPTPLWIACQIRKGEEWVPWEF